MTLALGDTKLPEGLNVYTAAHERDNNAPSGPAGQGVNTSLKYMSVPN